MRTIQRKNLGVTLAELMVAIAVLAIGLSGVAASLYFGFSKSNTGDDLATATQYSRMLIELVKGRNLVQNVPRGANGLPLATTGLNDPVAADPVPIDAPPFVAGDFLAYPSSSELGGAGLEGGKLGRDLTRYKRKITLERFSNTKTDPEFLMGRLKVTIYWEVKGVKKHATTAAAIPLFE